MTEATQAVREAFEAAILNAAPALRNAASRDLLQRAHGALLGAIQEYSRNVCEHEETKRGGAIWTICCQCDTKWADDRGGFQPYKEPERITTAWAVLHDLEAELQQPAAASASKEAECERLREALREIATKGGREYFEATDIVEYDGIACAAIASRALHPQAKEPQA